LAKTDRTGSIDRVEGNGHGVCDTVTFLQQEKPDFIPSTLWPLNLPDLIAVDYSNWILLQEVYHSRIITDLEELKDMFGQCDPSGHSLTSQSLMPLSASGAIVYVFASLPTGHISNINSNNVEPLCRETNCSVK